MSYFGKFYLTGPDAAEAADHLFSADTRRPEGSIVYTCMLNEGGGTEADLTVVRIGKELLYRIKMSLAYLVVSVIFHNVMQKYDKCTCHLVLQFCTIICLYTFINIAEETLPYGFFAFRYLVHV